MKKIVDINFMNTNELFRYLNRSKTNYIVLTDYNAMECYKGNGQLNIIKSMELISNFPTQVIILKSTSQIVRLNPKTKGYHKRITDQKTTRNFSKFISQLREIANGSNDYTESIIEHNSIAEAHLSELKNAISDHSTVFSRFKDVYGTETYKSIKNKTVHKCAACNLVNDSLKLCVRFLRNASIDIETSTVREFQRGYVFRFSVALNLLVLRMISLGFDPSKEIKKSKFLNDLVDITYISYASIFDGLLTNDKKMSELYSVLINFIPIIESFSNLVTPCASCEDPVDLGETSG